MLLEAIVHVTHVTFPLILMKASSLPSTDFPMVPTWATRGNRLSRECSLPSISWWDWYEHMSMPPSKVEQSSPLPSRGRCRRGRGLCRRRKPPCGEDCASAAKAITASANIKVRRHFMFSYLKRSRRATEWFVLSSGFGRRNQGRFTGIGTKSRRKATATVVLFGKRAPLPMVVCRAPPPSLFGAIPVVDCYELRQRRERKGARAKKDDMCGVLLAS